MARLGIVLVALLCLAPLSNCAHRSDLLAQYSSVDDWSQLDHWGTVLRVRRDFSLAEYDGGVEMENRNTTRTRGES